MVDNEEKDLSEPKSPHFANHPPQSEAKFDD